MKDLFSIEGKVALVTGGSRGIGSMIAAGFLASGAKVYISSRKAEVCDETAKKLSEEYGGECISIPADVSNVEGIEALADAIKTKEDKRQQSVGPTFFIKSYYGFAKQSTWSRSEEVGEVRIEWEAWTTP